MDKIWSFVIDFLIGVLAFFIAVLIYFGLRTETVVKSISTQITDDFITGVKENGCFTLNDYEKYMEKLSLTDTLYDVTFEHDYNIYEPEYRFRTLEEIIAAQKAAYTGANIYHYREVITEVPAVSDPVNTGLNTETNESVLASAVNTPALPSHVHTDACYLGHRHTDGAGVTSSSYKHGCYVTPKTTTTYCGGTYRLTNSFPYSNNYSCTWCGDSYSYSGTMYEYTCSACGNTASCGTTAPFTWTCSCGKTVINSSGNLGSASSGSSCSRSSSSTVYTCPLAEDTTPECSQIVSSITATHPEQKVATGDPLITTVRATYLDGSTKVVLASTAFSTSDIVQNSTVPLTYTYTLEGTVYTKTCNITVTVVPRAKTCAYGHTYNLKPDGSDGGCPYCRAYVRSINFIYPTTSTMTITIGTTLADNNIKLLITYYDGHTETLTSGYEDNLDKTYLGTKPVTIGYKGATAQLMVTTVCAKMTCDICGYVYDLYPDGTNPGCPKCISKTPVFTGNVLKYDETVYTEEILEDLFTDGEYRLNKDDTFIITVKNKSSTLARRILQKVIPSMTDRWYLLRLSEKIMEK